MNAYAKKVMTESKHTDEAKAHRARRSYIARGFKVSLVAFDSSRNVYVFDIYY